MAAQPYYVHQSGFEGAWLPSSVEVVRYLCDLFGWRFADRHQHLLPQIDGIERGESLNHPDLALTITRY